MHPTAQPGILQPIPAHGRYLTCQLRVEADPRTVLHRLASQADDEATVVAISASPVRELVFTAFGRSSAFEGPPSTPRSARQSSRHFGQPPVIRRRLARVCPDPRLDKYQVI